MINTLFLPFRLFCSHRIVNMIGLRSLRDERYDRVAEQCRGSLLDIGCGDNGLVKRYRCGVGVDVHDSGCDLVVENTSSLPFDNGEFDTVSFVASLNHIPYRQEVIAEASRVLSDKGRVVLTMLSPFIGKVRHWLAWWDADQSDRGMKAGEETGLSNKYIIYLFKNAGFRLVERKRFICCLNSLYVFEKE